jgi:hypothetical protein
MGAILIRKKSLIYSSKSRDRSVSMPNGGVANEKVRDSYPRFLARSARSSSLEKSAQIDTTGKTATSPEMQKKKSQSIIESVPVLRTSNGKRPLKVIIAGDFGIGKTSLVLRLTVSSSPLPLTEPS